MSMGLFEAYVACNFVKAMKAATGHREEPMRERGSPISRLENLYFTKLRIRLLDATVMSMGWPVGLSRKDSGHAVFSGRS